VRLSGCGDLLMLRISMLSLRIGRRQDIRLDNGKTSFPLVSDSHGEPGVERVTKSIAEQVETQDGESDGDTREDGSMRVALEVFATRAEHGAPLWAWRLCTETEEAQTGGNQDSGRRAEARLHDDRCDGVGQDVAEQDCAIRCADAVSCLDEIHGLCRQHA